MKSILLLGVLAFVASATSSLEANTQIDWNTVKPIYQLPAFAQRYPGLVRTINRFGNRRQNAAAPRIVGGEEAENGQFPYAVSKLGLILISHQC